MKRRKKEREFELLSFPDLQETLGGREKSKEEKEEKGKKGCMLAGSIEFNILEQMGI